MGAGSMLDLFADCKFLTAITATEGLAGTDAITGAACDTQGFRSVLILVCFGAIVTNAVTSIKVQQSSDNGAGDAYSDIAGSAQTVADSGDGKTFWIEIQNPGKRYLKLIVSRATQNATVFAQYILVGSRRKPVTQGNSAVIERFVQPAEGSA
jgi:hypothetical protein